MLPPPNSTTVGDQVFNTGAVLEISNPNYSGKWNKSKVVSPVVTMLRKQSLLQQRARDAVLDRWAEAPRGLRYSNCCLDDRIYTWKELGRKLAGTGRHRCRGTGLHKTLTLLRSTGSAGVKVTSTRLCSRARWTERKGCIFMSWKASEVSRGGQDENSHRCIYVLLYNLKMVIRESLKNMFFMLLKLECPNEGGNDMRWV